MEEFCRMANELYFNESLWEVGAGVWFEVTVEFFFSFMGLSKYFYDE